MINGIYTAASSMDNTSLQYEIVSRNLANANIPGFRKAMLPQSTFGEAARSAQESTDVSQDSALVNDFTPGAFERTGNTFDLAIQGQALFKVESPSGPLYTRNGSFHISPDRVLVSPEGFPVATENGRLTLPANANISEIKISEDGTVKSGTNNIGRISLTEFKSPEQLEIAGVVYFKAPASAETVEVKSLIVQGTRELSNVSPVQELVTLMSLTRGHEAAQRAIKVLDESIQNHINLRGS